MGHFQLFYLSVIRAAVLVRRYMIESNLVVVFRFLLLAYYIQYVNWKWIIYFVKLTFDFVPTTYNVCLIYSRMVNSQKFWDFTNFLWCNCNGIYRHVYCKSKFSQVLWHIIPLFQNYLVSSTDVLKSLTLYNAVNLKVGSWIVFW